MTKRSILLALAGGVWELSLARNRSPASTLPSIVKAGKCGRLTRARQTTHSFMMLSGDQPATAELPRAF